MSTILYFKNKWEDQRIKKKNRKQSNTHATRQFRKIHGRSSNSLKEEISFRNSKRETRMTKMKYDKEMCNDMNGYHHIDEGADDTLMAPEHNLIPVWICSYCTYRNIERKSFCKMCFSSYSSSTASVICGNKDTTVSTDITLGEFCKDIWDEINIPVWICGLCTYCNIEQLPQCQMCDNSYYSANNQTMDYQIKENCDEIYAEYIDNQKQLPEIDDYETYLFDDVDQNVIDDNNINAIVKCKQQQATETIHVSVTMKLTENKLYQKVKKLKLAAKNEDVHRYTLLECQLNLSANDNLINSYSYIPATKQNDAYSVSNYAVIVPIKYKYRNQFGEFVGYPKNLPVQSVGEFMWRSQYPSLQKIESIQWNIRYPDNKNIRSPVQKHEIFNVILQFIPLKDIIESILFKYLGYDDINIVKMWTTFHHNSKYFITYPMEKLNKKLFMKDNGGRWPFELYNTPYSTIKSRKINSDIKLTEIGYSNEYKKRHKQKHNNGYYGYHSSYGRTELSYYMQLKLAKFGRQPHPNDHRRSLRRKKRKFSAPTTNCGRHKRAWQLKGKKNRGKARAYGNVSKQVCLYKKWSFEPGYNRKDDLLDKRYMKKDKRYVERKWSAYWKLVGE